MVGGCVWVLESGVGKMGLDEGNVGKVGTYPYSEGTVIGAIVD